MQNRRYRRTQGNAANDSLTQGTIDKAVKKSFNNDLMTVMQLIVDTFNVHMQL